MIAGSMVAAMAGAVSASPKLPITPEPPAVEPTPLSPEELRDRLREHFKVSPADQALFDTLPKRYQQATEQRSWVIQCACGIRSEVTFGTQARAAIVAIRKCGFKVVEQHLFCRKCAKDPKRRSKYTTPVQKQQVSPQRRLEPAA